MSNTPFQVISMKSSYKRWRNSFWKKGCIGVEEIPKNLQNIFNQWIHKTNDEGIVLEKRVHGNSSRKCEILLQWVW
jgi:hypothetical protein